MGCGSSSLTGDSFDGISANKAQKIEVHSESSYKHESLYSSLPTSSSDPTKGPYLHSQNQHEEPLRDKALPTTSEGRYRKPSYHGKSAYHDMTMPNDEEPTSPPGHTHKDSRGRQVRMQSWSERKHGGPEPRDPKTGRGLFTGMLE